MSDGEQKDLSYHAQPSPICYLIAATKASGVKDAAARGWTQIAAHRFATPEKLDVRIAITLRECIPTPGGTRLFKGADYDSGPDGASVDELKAWMTEQERFGHFVERGQGRWIE